MSTKYVYTFGDGKAEGKADMKNLLGGKGANLAEMNLIGLKKSESKRTCTGDGPASHGYGMEGGGAFQTTDHH